MNKKIQNEIIKHYSELYQKFGKTSASLGWPKGRQSLRFKILTEIGKINNSKILDVGCGFGDLLSYLKSKKYNIDYHGVDINPIFVDVAKKFHQDGKFYVKDIEKRKFKKKFDWVFAIGTTNKAANYEYVENLLKEMFRISRKGIAMDFMSTYVDFRRKGSKHFSPEKIFNLAKKMSKRVVIRHDYLPFEFCVYFYKNNKLKKNQTFIDF